MSHLYFNNAFSRRPLSECITAMQPYLFDEFENPLTESSAAEKAREAILKARAAVSAVINANPSEIFFVSSGTEANNWALKGAALSEKKNHIVISAIEHFSVYQTAAFQQRHGARLSIIPVNREGLIDPDQLAQSITSSTILVSIQCASDEVGVIQNYPAISALKEKFRDVLFHTDAIQFSCYENLDVGRTPFDLVSLSSNALYGPPGIAALYIREGTRLQPLLHGGMQEEGMRPGLQSIALIVGFGKAAEINRQMKDEWKSRVARLQERLFGKASALSLRVIGSRSCRLVDNIHVIADVEGEALLTLLLERRIRASSGSTCYQFAQKESHVLKALGITPDEARGSLLFTIDKDHSDDDIDFLVNAMADEIEHLRRIKP